MLSASSKRSINFLLNWWQQLPTQTCLRQPACPVGRAGSKPETDTRNPIALQKTIRNHGKNTTCLFIIPFLSRLHGTARSMAAENKICNEHRYGCSD